MEYSRRVAEYFSRPVNVGVPPGEPASLCVGEAGNREHGVHVVFTMRVVDQRVEELRFSAFACPHTIAACCYVTERLAGAPVGTLLELSPDELMKALDVPVEKMGRMLLVQDALRDCFVAWDNKGGL